MAPSAVSRKVAELERRLGASLLERSARGIRPTEAGDLVARFADDRAHLEELFRDELDQLAGVRRGRVRIAAGEGFVDDLVAHGLTPFLQDHPGISAELTLGGTDEICDLLRDDDVDLGLVLHARPHRDLDVVAQAPQPLHLICRPDHPFAARSEVLPDDLAGQPATVLPMRFGIRTLTDQLERMHGVSLDVRLVSESIQAMIDFVRAGAGITLLPRFAVGRDVERGRLCAVPVAAYEPGTVRAQLLVRRGRTPSHGTARLLDYCAARLASLQHSDQGSSPHGGA
ncbi:LysR family transcriptional regulator [Phytoactinopolyspora halotolerans]|uniref:LysR family transcriptional regulator n=1 Tax=Phytoactinopolyspora halotolerans TaxID=1981512 RepID=A0A6L9SHW9_9ACTN|nr:LysR family transcriptional regulator [Phytoactinopolyspora halotolerans]NEE04799.1 LysR family transcriptional regulator [Phytoactinopolyspora halotolerans]